MYAYIITFLIALSYLIFGTIVIIKNKVVLDKTKKIILAIVLFSLYYYPLIETVSNSRPTNYYFLLLLPTYNYTPVIFIASIIGVLTKGKISNIFNSFVALMIIPVLYGIGEYTYLYMTTFKVFYERFACYILGQATIVLYGIYLVRNKIVTFNFKNILGGILLLLIIYLFNTIHNLVYDTTFFGLSFNDNYYIYNLIKLENSELSLIVNYLSIFITVTFTGIILNLIQKKWTN